MKDGEQTYNPLTEHYIKRINGILEVRKDGRPFKNIPIVRNVIMPNPNIDSETAQKAEDAVIEVLNKKSND